MQSIFSSIIDKKLLSILKVFLNHPENLYHLQKVSIDAKIPLGTTFRLVNKLAKAGIIKITVVGKLKLYSLGNDEKLELLKRLIQ